jgi:hypothetical protein
MGSIVTTAALKESIIRLENQQKDQLTSLKQQISIAREYIKPANLIKETLKNTIRSPKIITGILFIAAGLATSMSLRKKTQTSDSGFFKKILGTVLQSVIRSAFSGRF